MARNRYTEDRNKAETNIGAKMMSENLVGKLLQNEKNWEALSEILSTIMNEKIEDERTKEKETQ